MLHVCVRALLVLRPSWGAGAPLLYLYYIPVRRGGAPAPASAARAVRRLRSRSPFLPAKAGPAQG